MANGLFWIANYPGFCAFYLVTTVVKNILGQTYTPGIKIIRRIESLIGIIRFKKKRRDFRYEISKQVILIHRGKMLGSAGPGYSHQLRVRGG
ncbi:Uncharacterised protein [Salmonella enterica subsp. enterica]|nr:Uncharacterised protein [Salmonella enterica subsp. enterica]